MMDAIRGIAALWILFFHLNEGIEYRNDLYSHFCKLGYLGVPAFFVISGWCMQSIQLNTAKPAKFLLARSTRIYPPYLASLAVTLLVLFSNKIIRGVNDLHVTLSNKGIGLLSLGLMMPSPATEYHGLNWSYWTLPIELAFYITVAAGIWIACITRVPNAKIFVVDFLLIFSLLIGLSGAKTEATLIYWAPYYKLFALGIYAKYLSRNWLAPFRAKAPAMIRLLLAFLAIAVTQSDIKTTVAAIIVCAALLIEQNTILTIKPSRLTAATTFLGLISYSIYLLHVPIGCWIFARFRPEAVLDNQVIHLLADTVIAFLIICLSNLFYKRIESRFHDMSRRIASA